MSTMLPAPPSSSLIPSHAVATTILKYVDRFLDFLGLAHRQNLEEILYTIIIIAVSLAIGLSIRWIVVWALRKMVKHRKSDLMQQMLKMRTISKCSHFITPMVFFALIPFAFVSDHHSLDLILRIVGVYSLITIGIAISAILELAWWRFDNRDNQYNHPLKGILNVCRGLTWIIIGIISISILIDKSPTTLLAGLGAFAAALMLIFKDSILGFVAGIQLSTNDMLRVGDWIVVPSTMANGTVIDVTLTVVKVQNWDNTIIMLPPYTLVSTSFQNWRGMYDAGCRLVNRDVYFAQPSIKPVTQELLDKIVEQFPEMAKYVSSRMKAKAEGLGNVYNNWTEPNGTIDTNLGLFRAYLSIYLLHHPAVQVNNTQFLIIALDPAVEYGQPLNIEFFSSYTAWAPFEAALSEIFEHIAVTAPVFGLVLSNAPDGNKFTIRNETPASFAGNTGE